MGIFRDYLSELSAATHGRAAESSWRNQARPQKTPDAPARTNEITPDQRAKMTALHTKGLAAAKSSGDSAGVDYHEKKLNLYK